ncbi:hypothetical protein H310_14615 [Aphanomyces invadans]|uniref:Tryptophan synthase beta chain-like PALP domain-containing protein n=1 Tax=Aphanomyces invadans TaxID=157072 RepID=A0A024T9D7_9STRA|nr:hypothetical protein H310_14615 [Aphanomyces invadans]ETV90663.1 hypothetical protein H310_14615 [Aphanomyces invadans]|eukprot:XP_008880733.1 hypothetical protein H310_14615 [Aphanomyces invadans]
MEVQLILLRFHRRHAGGHAGGRNDGRHTIITAFSEIMKLLPPTKVQRVRCRGFDLHIKRDDLHFLPGNKFRKLFWLVEKDASFFTGNHLLSYGGIQSNAMLAVAQLAHLKQVPFTYFTKPISTQLLDRAKNLKSNFNLALSLGMHHVALENEYDALADSHDFTPIAPLNATRWLGIPQGVALPEAAVGIRRLALELNDFAESYANNVAVVLPCGTGTTAHYVAKYIHPSIRVYGVPCVGSAAYLREQLAKLDATAPGSSPLYVLEPRKRVAFGTLWRPLLDTYYEVLKDTGVEIDLIYGCLAWDTMLNAFDRHEFEGRQVVYIHSGGLSGNSSQLERYRNRFQSE